MSVGPSHIPVLLDPLLRAVAPVAGTWIDGTFGAGGYALGLLDAGADRVIGIDRDPLAIEMAAPLLASHAPRLALVEGEFAAMDSIADGQVDGVVLDLGVSSMQIDIADRGFSFLRDGPLDMRMSQSGRSAADLINGASEAQLADILFQYGEERASRRIARAITARRAEAAIETTAELAEIVANCLPRPKPGQTHPATRTFQALRIAVNDEFGQLIAGLEAAERALKPGGKLAVVTFHSSEDRVVKRFLALRAGRGGRANRFAPDLGTDEPQFRLLKNGAISANKDELERNPRARSAKLRLAERLSAAPRASDRSGLGLPGLALED